MSSFDVIARRVVVEAQLSKESGITPEYVFTAWLSERYRRVIDGIRWGNINKQTDAVFVTTAEYNTGTVDVTNGSATVVGTDTVFASGMVGRYFRIPSQRGWYKIAGFTDTTHITLDTVWAGATAEDSTYSIAQRYHVLPTGVRWVTGMRINNRYDLDIRDQSVLDHLFPTREINASIPQWASPAGWDISTGRRIYELYPFADAAYRVEVSGYANIDAPTFTGSPIPDVRDRVLIEGTLADVFNYCAAKPELDVTARRGYLDLSARHEHIFTFLVDELTTRDSTDGPQPRVSMHWRSGMLPPGYYLRDSIVTAEDQVWLEWQG